MKILSHCLFAALTLTAVSGLASESQLTCKIPRTGSPIYQVTFNSSSSGAVTAAVVRATPGTPAYGNWVLNCQNTSGGPYALAVYQCSGNEAPFRLALKPDFSARKQFAEITDAGGVVGTVWCE